MFPVLVLLLASSLFRPLQSNDFHITDNYLRVAGHIPDETVEIQCWRDRKICRLATADVLRSEAEYFVLTGSSELEIASWSPHAVLARSPYLRNIPAADQVDTTVAIDFDTMTVTSTICTALALEGSHGQKCGSDSWQHGPLALPR